jgi:starvation-inducible DNA-binding protein
MSTETLTRKESTAVNTCLSTCIADTYALLAQTHVAHWNVEGQHFFSLHAAFQTQYEELFIAVDDLAERLRALEGYAPGGLKTLGKMSTIDELSIGANPAKDYVAALVEANEIVEANLTVLRDEAEKARDLETQDLAIGRLRVHEKTLWMLRSFLKNL